MSMSIVKIIGALGAISAASLICSAYKRKQKEDDLSDIDTVDRIEFVDSSGITAKEFYTSDTLLPGSDVFGSFQEVYIVDDKNDVDVCVPPITLFMSGDEYAKSLRKRLNRFVVWDKHAQEEKDKALDLIKKSATLKILIDRYLHEVNFSSEYVSRGCTDLMVKIYAFYYLSKQFSNRESFRDFMHGCFKIFTWETQLISKYGNNAIKDIEDKIINYRTSVDISLSRVWRPFENDCHNDIEEQAAYEIIIPFLEYTLLTWQYGKNCIDYLDTFKALFTMYYKIDKNLYEKRVNEYKMFLDYGNSRGLTNSSNFWSMADSCRKSTYCILESIEGGFKAPYMYYPGYKSDKG